MKESGCIMPIPKFERGSLRLPNDTSDLHTNQDYSEMTFGEILGKLKNIEGVTVQNLEAHPEGLTIPTNAFISADRIKSHPVSCFRLDKGDITIIVDIETVENGIRGDIYKSKIFQRGKYFSFEEIKETLDKKS